MRDETPIIRKQQLIAFSLGFLEIVVIDRTNDERKNPCRVTSRLYLHSREWKVRKTVSK